jgi:predicted PurR-regulated permease PerM
LTTLLFVGGLLLPFVLLLISAIRAGMAFVSDFLDRTHGSGEDVVATVLHQGWAQRILRLVSKVSPLSEREFRDQLLDVVQKVGVRVGEFLGASLQQTPQALVFLFILIVAIYYFMVDGERVRQFLLAQSPFGDGETHAIMSQVRNTSVRTLAAAFAVSGTQALLLLVGMLLTGVPAPFLWFTVAFLMAFLPIVGSVPVSLGCVVYLLANSGTWEPMVMGVVMLLAGLSDNLVRPLVIGGANAQHPLITLLSLFGGLFLLGFAGVLIGPILASLFLATLEHYAEAMRPSRKLAVPPGEPLSGAGSALSC